MANSKGQMVNHLKFAVCHLPFDLLACLVDRGYGTLLLAIAASLLLSTQLAFAQVPDGVIARAAAEFDQQKYLEAEETLRSALAEHPRDARALGLMGVILDAQERYEAAERCYNLALEVDPHDASLLNNLGNHYLERNMPDRARAAFLRVIAIDPSHPNANLQLAQISVDAKRGEQALRYFGHLPASEQARPAAQLLRAKALAYAGQQALAQQVVAQLEKDAPGTPGLEYSVGLLMAQWGRYADAEQAFAKALHDNPADFDILYNLGLAAQKAGHVDRAREVFEAALKQRPEDPDCLFNLALVLTETSRADKAVVLLLQAHSAAPQRPEILHALADASEQIGFYADAASALDQYLKLKPQDGVARRERGFCHAFSGDVDLGLADLAWYTRKYPEDPRGLYELAIAETTQDAGKALEHLTHALEIDPKMTVARYARAVLRYQQGEFKESLNDLKLILAGEPGNALALDMAGQNYMRLQQPEEAVKFLAQAAERKPNDSRLLMHYSQALVRVGRSDEAEKVTARFKVLDPEARRERAQGGLFKFLDLAPEEQFSRYITNLRRTINARPDDPAPKVRLGQALLYQGDVEEAVELFRTARQETSDPAILARCGKSLLEGEQYVQASEFLEPAVAGNPLNTDVRIDLVIAVFHSRGPEAALQVLDKMAGEQRKGDYFLLRAQLLDALRRPQEAAEALNRGIQSTPTRPDLYFQAALFMIDHNQVQEMLDFLTKAERVVPNDPQLWLTRAIGFAILHQTGQAAGVLTKMESEWPEWYLPYLVHGVMLDYSLRGTDAKPLLETAIALGAHLAMAYYHLASAMLSAEPADVPGAKEVIGEALALNSKDAFIQSLAGKIGYLGKDYPAAIAHLQAALEIWPDMIEAHETLSATYRALGEKDKSVEELKTVLRIKEQNPGAVQIAPFPTNDLLFTVSETGSPR
jgi:tetratricopeptide (TPR) repeat protein